MIGESEDMRKIKILKANVSTRKVEHATDLVAEEMPLHIFLNKLHFVTILCSPCQLKELALGHVLSEGVVKSVDEVRKILFEEEKQICRIQFKLDVDINEKIKLARPFSRLITSSCNPPDYWPFPKLIDRIKLPKVSSNLVVKAQTISNCVKNLNIAAETFRKTGGVHVAALHEQNGDLVALAEDVGRHNAVDKIIGIRALKGLGFRECFLALSGRLTGDIVLKAARIGLPIVASQAAAIKSGIEVAEYCKITIIGFARGKRMNIYTYPERITH